MNILIILRWFLILGIMSAEIARRVNNLGLRTRKQVMKWVVRGWKEITWKWIDRILENPFYYWVIPHLGEIFEWNHEPLVSKEVWEKVNWKEKKKYTFYKKWALKWKVIFKDTWKPMCVTEKIRKNKTNDKVRKYIYYHTPWENQV